MITWGGWILNEDSQRLCDTRLTPTQTRLTRALIEGKGGTVSHEQLQAALCSNRAKDLRLLEKVIVCQVNQRVETSRGQRPIRVDWGLGYRLLPRADLP